MSGIRKLLNPVDFDVFGGHAGTYWSVLAILTPLAAAVQKERIPGS